MSLSRFSQVLNKGEQGRFERVENGAGVEVYEPADIATLNNLFQDVEIVIDALLTLYPQERDFALSIMDSIVKECHRSA